MSTKVFIGLVDIASFIDDWSEGFKQNNINTLKGSHVYQASIQNSKLDFIIQKAQDKVGYFKPHRISSRIKALWNKNVKTYYFKKAIRECDTFLFIWNSFEADFSDYKILKDHGKKIITVFVGDEIRWGPAMKQEFNNIGLPAFEYGSYDFPINDLRQRLNFLRVVEKYSDIILGQPNIMQLSLRPYQNLYIPIVASDYKEMKEQRIKPIIVHAPTSIGKGTKYIEPIIERLKAEGYEFEYKRIQNVPRPEALSIYENADIILDQILLPGGGKLAHEGLAMGKVVLTLMAFEKYDQKKPTDNPLVDIDEKNLYEVLKKLIPNVDLRNDIASKGRPFIEKYHSPKFICANIIKNLKKSNDDVESDFKPTFFREQFIPESTEAAEVYNEWNNYVKDCNWYKTNVEPGERAGLKF